MKGFPQALQVTVPVLFRIASWIFRKFVCLTMWSENWSRLWKGPGALRCAPPVDVHRVVLLVQPLGSGGGRNNRRRPLRTRCAPCRRGSWAP